MHIRNCLQYFDRLYDISDITAYPPDSVVLSAKRHLHVLVLNSRVRLNKGRFCFVYGTFSLDKNDTFTPEKNWEFHAKKIGFGALVFSQIEIVAFSTDY